ncbi:MAG: hypothetical protein RR945_10320, partial [Erysipelotrichaceae bacterium]
VSNYIGEVVNDIAGNISNALSGGSNKIKPVFKIVEVKADCPKKEITDIKDDIINVITYCMDWPKLVKEVILLFKNGFKTSWLTNLLNCITDGKVRDKWVTVKGARDIVKNITGLGVGGKRPISSIIKKAFKKSLGFNSIKTFAKFLEWGKLDYISVAADMILGLLTPIRILSNIAADAIYKVLKKSGATAIKALLTPFIGPFAWLLSTILEIGTDIIDFFVDLKSKISDFVEWVMKQTWSFVTSLFDAVGGKL